jgi:uncharacterized protein YecE (DUF72 family)
MNSSNSKLHIGCSGFTYKHWSGNFYPQGLPQREWFNYYSSIFAAVELNVTFYRLVKPETFIQWREKTPQGFIFAVKGSRFITHIKRLKEPEEALERFFSGVLELGGKLSAVLWQLPPNLACNIQLLADFLQCLQPYQVRNAMEFRHESWLNDEVVELCRSRKIALCMADWPPFLNSPPLTADFVYIRRHGHDQSYSGNYSTEELEADAGRIREYLASGRDVQIYFNNDIGGYAPRNAQELAAMMDR